MPNATSLSQDPQSAGQPLFTSSATQYHELGAKMVTGDGREYRYCLAGGVSTVPGQLYSAAAQTTAHQNVAVAAAAIGATTVTLTGSLTLTSNQYAQGWLIVSVTPGQGYMYKVSGNTAVTSATGCVITLNDPILVALTTASTVSLVLNPYSLVIVAPTTATANPVGASVYIITNGQYGWLQTKGPASLLNDANTAVGLPLAPSTNTAGAVLTATGSIPAIGIAMQTLATTKYGPVFLMLP